MKQYYRTIFVSGCFFFFFESSLTKAEEYTIIAEKNLFSPTRQKFVSHPKTFSKKKTGKAVLPELHGTIISGDSKLAVFSFRKSYRKPPAPVSRSTRGKRGRKNPVASVVAPRTNDTRVVSVGERFGDYRLLAIEDKQVTLDCDGERISLSTLR